MTTDCYAPVQSRADLVGPDGTVSNNLGGRRLETLQPTQSCRSPLLSVSEASKQALSALVQAGDRGKAGQRAVGQSSQCQPGEQAVNRVGR